MKPKLDRYAFLLGNANYGHIAPLSNPTNDIARVSAELRGLGYTVYEHFNLDWRNTWMWIDDFVGAAGECEAIVFYYCGHGLQLDGQNYIVPIDFDPAVPVDLGDHAENMAGLVCVQDIMSRMLKADTRVIFLDACRDSGDFKEIKVRPPPEAAPARQQIIEPPKTRSLRSGLAKQRLKEYPQTFICYAADPGDVAEDGPEGGMSPFSSSVSSHMGLRGLDVFDMSQRIARDVRKTTEGRQTPWSNSNLTRKLSIHEKNKQPIWIMALLGALSGLIGAMLSFSVFDDVLKKYSVIDEPLRLLVPLLFGSVLGFGAYWWGKRKWYVFAGTCLFYAAVAALCRYWFDSYIFEPELREVHGNWTWELLKGKGAPHKAILLYAILASALAGAATIFSAAPFVRDMTRVGTIALGALIGSVACGFFLAFLYFRRSVVDPTGTTYVETGAVHSFEVALVILLFMVWEGFLAANVGWAYAEPTYED